MALILGVDYVSFAATGNSLLLGAVNQTPHLTTVERTTTGPVLRLKTKNPTDSPMTTNATGLVKHLDADKVDGKDASDFATHGQATGLISRANELHAQVTDLQSRLAAIEAKSPTTRAYVFWSPSGMTGEYDGTGISGVTWDAANGRWAVTFSQGFTSFYSHVVTVTPIGFTCSGVTYAIDADNSGHLLVKFLAGSTATRCNFYLTVGPY